MAFHKNLVKEWYKDLSIEDLEEQYYALQKDYYFEDKNKQIEYMISIFFDASHNVNTNSTKEGLEELLKEKTGKDYKLKEQHFDVSVVDFIEYLDKNIFKDSKTKSSLLTFFNNENLKNIFDNEEDTEDGMNPEEGEKIFILLCLLQDKKMLKHFLKEINNTKNAEETFKKYCDWAENYYSMNSRIG